MKQIEVTTRVNQTLEEAEKILIEQGFKLIRRSRIEDKYMTQSSSELTKENVLGILKNVY